MNPSNLVNASAKLLHPISGPWKADGRPEAFLFPRLASYHRNFIVCSLIIFNIYKGASLLSAQTEVKFY